MPVRSGVLYTLLLSLLHRTTLLCHSRVWSISIVKMRATSPVDRPLWYACHLGTALSGR